MAEERTKHANTLLWLESLSWIVVQLLQMALQGKKIDLSNVIFVKEQYSKAAITVVALVKAGG